MTNSVFSFQTFACKLRRAAHLLVYAVLALMPFTWEFKGLAPADVALGLAAGLWVLALALDWKTGAPALRGLARYWPMGLYALWTVVAACFAESPKLALVKVFQTVEYFLVAIVLLHDFLGTTDYGLRTTDFTRRLRNTGGVVLAVFAACLALAAWQYFNGLGDDDSFGVRGFFKHRNIFAGYVALLAPVCFGVMCAVRNWALKIGLGLLAALALLVALSGAAYAAVLLAIAGLAAVRGKGWFLATVAALAFFHVALEKGADHGFLRNNIARHLESVEMYESDGQPAPRYPEWQAAAYLLADYPLAGVGPGKNYQHKIGQYFGVIPRSPRDKNESDVEIQNQWLLLGATLGIPGLLAFLAMLVSGVCAGARAAWRMGRGDWRRGLAGGLVAGLLAYASVLVWHSALVRGVGLVFVAMLAACHALDAETEREKTP